MTPGNQATQAAHAAFEFCYQHPQKVFKWIEESNYLVLLSAPDEESILALASRANDCGLVHTITCEPDFGDEVTALVIEPGDVTSKLCSNLPLALREEVAV